jgi:G3E family GTPase
VVSRVHIGPAEVAETPDERYVLQVVGRRTQLSPLGLWADQPRRSQIVAIGKDFDAEGLDRLFDQCLIEP